MILSRTPLRIPLGGGGTDLPAFYKKHGGFLFSACIDKFMYVGANYSAVENVIRITHSDAEVVNSLEEIKHDLARQALMEMNVPVQGLEIVSFADLPPGTGLGSSGSYLVGLLKILHEMQNKKISEQDLAELACHIEINILKKPVGKQDQYLAAFGGFLAMDIAENGVVNAKKLSFSQKLVEELNSKSLMFYTFKKHDSIKILTEQSQKAELNSSDAEKAMLKIKDIGKELLSEFERGRISNFGKLMHEHWLAKKTISGQMSDPNLDDIYNKALSFGADGGKIMGSGGGGCFLFFVPGDRTNFISQMEKEGLKYIPYKFEMAGTSIV